MTFSPPPSLVSEHRQWFAAFDSQYLSNWEKLLSADAEAAMTEAGFRRILQENGCSVEPNETLDGSQQRPDFRCIRDGVVFYVEVTCISIQKAAECTNMPQTHAQLTHTASSNGSLVDAFFGAAKAKAPQCGNLDAPALVAIGTFHDLASIVFIRPYDVETVLTGKWQLFVTVDPITHEVHSESHRESQLASAAFLRPSAPRFAHARSSISGLLLGGLGDNEPNVMGALHPKPVRPFNRACLPKVRFCELNEDYTSGVLRTQWI